MKAILIKYLPVFSLMLVLNLSFGMQKTPDAKNIDSEFPAIIPTPQNIFWGTEFYILPVNNTICYDAESANSFHWVEKLLNAAGKKSNSTEAEDCGNWKLSIDEQLKDELGEEGYKLKIDNAGVNIQSAT